jgi:hypothetical protein
MDRPHYEIEYSLPLKVYLFVSEGKHGRVKKIVKFNLIQKDLFNLGFGDWKEDDHDFDDLVVTDNGDMEMVLSTVIKITGKFLYMNPGVSVYLTGSTASRTRLYRLIISNNYEIIRREYNVWGYWHGGWCPFEKNVNYEAFLVSKLL